MLARSLPQGSQAISFQNTLFRVSELCWVKAVRLSALEIVVKIASLAVAVGWVFAMSGAKGSFLNVEFLLAIFPLVLAWPLFGSHKIGCTGDFEEAYDSRGGFDSKLFRGWIDTLRKREPDWLYLKGHNYDLLFNPHRIAWIRPCVQWSVFPLMVITVFTGYLVLIDQSFNLDGFPVFDDFQVLLFPGGSTAVKALSYVVILIALLAFGMSVKRSVEVCGTGGVQDVFPVSASDQDSILNLLAGVSAADSRVANERTVTATVSPPVKKAEPPAPAPREAETPVATPDS